MNIKDHWYRPGQDDDRCGYDSCSAPERQHAESVAERIDMKPHFAVPHPLSPTFCFRCNRHIGHSVHPLIPKGLRK